MDPITIYRLAKLQQDEMQVEFERYQNYRLRYPKASDWSPHYRRLVGWGSLVLTMLMIVYKISG